MGNLFGSLLAVYFLVGRWSLGRLSGGTEDPILSQPRLWIVIAMVPVVLLLRRPPTSQRLDNGSKPVDVAVWLFLTYMVAAVVWAADTGLALEKAWELGLMLLVAMFIGTVRKCSAEHQILDGFWWTIVLFGVMMAGVATLLSAGGRIHVPGGGPNAFGRNMGLMGLGAVYLGGKYGIKAKPFCAAAIVVSALCILLCGSRGALLSTSAGAAVLLATARQALPKKVAVAGVVALLGLIVVLNTSAGQNALETFRERIIHQTLEKRYLSDRDDLWLDAVDWIKEHPWIGLGLNGYRAYNGIYPHNIFLEATVEGGIIGLLLLLNIVRAWWSAARRVRYRVPWVTFSALALVFTAAQTSGDLFDSRGVFVLVALAVPLAESSTRLSTRASRSLRVATNTPSLQRPRWQSPGAVPRKLSA